MNIQFQFLWVLEIQFGQINIQMYDLMSEIFLDNTYLISLHHTLYVIVLNASLHWCSTKYLGFLCVWR